MALLDENKQGVAALEAHRGEWDVACHRSEGEVVGGKVLITSACGAHVADPMP